MGTIDPNGTRQTQRPVHCPQTTATGHGMNERQHQAHQLMQRCIAQLRQAGIALPDIELRFDLRGSHAGLALCHPDRAPVIRLNPVLMAENAEFVAETVPHEVAHVGVFYLLGRPARRPHGPEWRQLMGVLDAEPERGHRYDVSNAVTRRLKRYRYACGCREHRLTSIRHNRIRRGAQYRCRECGEPLRVPAPD